MRRHWSLDPNVLHLNHGSYGACPTAVLEAQQRWRSEFESNPTGFIEDRYPGALASVRDALAMFVGSSPAALGFVTNATTGVASVVNSLDFGAGDEIVSTDHAYNACRNIVDVRADEAGAKVITAAVRFPGASAEQVVESVLSKVTDATKLVVVDHVTSPTGLVLPVEEIVAALEPDIPVLVDGAHAPGMIPLDLDGLGASFYTGNLHKWVCAPKGAAFLSVAERHRHRIRPTVISHGWNTPRDGVEMFHRLFDWTGTFDPTAWLTVPTAIDAMAGMHPDGWAGVMRSNREMALAARRLLCERLGIDTPAPESMIGSLASVPLRDVEPGLAARLRHRGIVALVSSWPDAEHQVLRVSAQRYNVLEEYHALADAILTD